LLFLKDGRIVTDGPTEKVFTPEVLAEVYDTAMEVRRHPRSGRPYAVMLPLAEAEEMAEPEPEAARA
jgi:iron complex transport system ATP-binding protein